jgi:segregation and condensation protein B
MTLQQVIEALLFASPKPLTVGEIRSALQAAGGKAENDGPERELALSKDEEIQAALEELQGGSDAPSRGFVVVEQVNGWALLTNPAASPWVRRLYPEAKPTRLSGPALETLAIIAYRQPVTRADVEAVRGVAVDGVMQVLLDRSLVKIAGRAEVPGRPLLYSTTEFFLQHFGLRNVEELPNSAELKRYPLPTAPLPPAGETSAPTKKAARAQKAEGGDGTSEATAPEEPAVVEPETASADEAPAPESPAIPASDESIPEEPTDSPPDSLPPSE